MSANKYDLKRDFNNLCFDVNLLKKTSCSEEDNAKYNQMLQNGETLPEGVFEYIYDIDGEDSGSFYKINKPNLTTEERLEYIALKQLKALNTIKKCVVFFTVLTIISMIITFFSLMKIS